MHRFNQVLPPARSSSLTYRVQYIATWFYAHFGHRLWITWQSSHHIHHQQHCDPFDGPDLMPMPKSLHVRCALTDAVLGTVLGQLPGIEEFQCSRRRWCWNALTPTSCGLRLPITPLVPCLEILLINCSTCRSDYTTTMAESEWYFSRASAVAAAREQAGRTLVCWSVLVKI
jgi:hypothetical protein